MNKMNNSCSFVTFKFVPVYTFASYLQLRGINNFLSSLSNQKN